MNAESPTPTDAYPDGTRAISPGWDAVKRDGVWWGGDFNGIRLGENWDVPEYAIITLPGKPVPAWREVAARVFAKQRELAAEKVEALCDVEVIEPNDNDQYGWFCVRELGHPDEDGFGEGSHRSR